MRSFLFSRWKLACSDLLITALQTEPCDHMMERWLIANRLLIYRPGFCFSVSDSPLPPPSPEHSKSALFCLSNFSKTGQLYRTSNGSNCHLTWFNPLSSVSDHVDRHGHQSQRGTARPIHGSAFMWIAPADAITAGSQRSLIISVERDPVQEK